MEWQGVLRLVKLVVATLPAEIDFLVLSQIAYAEYSEGPEAFSLASFVGRLLDQAETVFPDPNTRPFAEMILQAWARLLAGPVRVSSAPPSGGL